MKKIILSLILIFSMSTASFSHDGLIPFKKNGVWGYVNLNGKVVIKPQFIEAASFHEGIAVIKDFDMNSKSNRYGAVGIDGKIIAEPKYEFIQNFSEKRAAYRISTGDGRKYGYLDDKGNVVTHAVFDEALPFINGFAIVKIENKYGYINPDGNVVIKPIYDIAYNFREGAARVVVGDKTGYINTNGDLIGDAVYIDGGDFSESYAAVRTESGYGYIDKSGIIVINGNFDYAVNFSDGLAVIKKNGYYGYADTQGAIVISPEYDFAYSFSGKLASVEKNKRFFFINGKGEKQFKVDFEEAFPFYNGMARVKKNGKYGFIDTNGKFVIKAKYSRAEDFTKDIAVVEYDNKKILIDKKGKTYRFGDGESKAAYSPGVKDIEEIKQDALEYVNQKIKNENIVLAQHQNMQVKYFNQMYFAAWNKSRASNSSKEMIKTAEYFSNNPGYGENKQKHGKEWVDEIKRNMELEKYPSQSQRGITLRNANLRVLPTQKAHYNDFALPGEGFPFDNLQNSAISANTPVFIVHKTLDNSWYYVDGPFCSGWIDADDIGFVDDEFVKNWAAGKYGILIRDNVPITDNDGIYRMNSDIGAIFPIINETESEAEIKIAVSDIDKKAVIKTAKLSKEQITAKPLELSQQKIAETINKLLNTEYGWGGLYDNRDCSSTLRDLFVPFGLWMPRNSADQARNGFFISLKNLRPADKEKMILENGVPFLTLIWLKGHIMLYIGSSGSRALVFHNIWGLRTKDEYGTEGRKIIGGTIISTLEPGKELPEIYSTLLDKIEGMTIIVPPKKIQNILAFEEE